MQISALTRLVVQAVQIQPLRGFDRLATAGFSEEDIANFRRQFHSQSSSNYLDLAFENDEQCVCSPFQMVLD